jgi:hypothetical protein
VLAGGEEGHLYERACTLIHTLEFKSLAVLAGSEIAHFIAF